MIALENVTKIVSFSGDKRKALSSVSVNIPSNKRIALLGPLEQDKNILIDLLAGISLPSSGRILRKARVSFPIGYLGGFAPDMSVRHNVAHVARLYGADVRSVTEFVERLANLGASFNRPYRDLPSDVKRRLGQIVAYSIPFDVYVLNLGRGGWRQLGDALQALVEARVRPGGMIIGTCNARFAREYCDMGIVLHRGQVLLFDDVEQAILASENL